MGAYPTAPPGVGFGWPNEMNSLVERPSKIYFINIQRHSTEIIKMKPCPPYCFWKKPPDWWAFWNELESTIYLLMGLLAGWNQKSTSQRVTVQQATHFEGILNCKQLIISERILNENLCLNPEFLLEPFKTFWIEFCRNSFVVPLSLPDKPYLIGDRGFLWPSWIFSRLLF